MGLMPFSVWRVDKDIVYIGNDVSGDGQFRRRLSSQMDMLRSESKVACSSRHASSARTLGLSP